MKRVLKLHISIILILVSMQALGMHRMYSRIAAIRTQAKILWAKQSVRLTAATSLGAALAIGAQTALTYTPNIEESLKKPVTVKIKASGQDRTFYGWPQYKTIDGFNIEGYNPNSITREYYSDELRGKLIKKDGRYYGIPGEPLIMPHSSLFYGPYVLATKPHTNRIIHYGDENGTLPSKFGMEAQVTLDTSSTSTKQYAWTLIKNKKQFERCMINPNSSRECANLFQTINWKPFGGVKFEKFNIDISFDK